MEHLNFMEAERPKPEALLQRLKEEERQEKGGKLKIYLLLPLELAKPIPCFKMLLLNVFREKISSWELLNLMVERKLRIS